MPSQELPKNKLSIPHLDKIVHFGMFFILSIISNFEQKKGKKFRNNFLLAITIAILTETAQKTLTPDRQFEIFDIVADISGFIVGYFFYKKLNKN